MPRNSKSIYKSVIQKVFEKNYRRNATSVKFTRKDIDDAAISLKVDPKNLGDLVYYFRYRHDLPETIQDLCKGGNVWIIRGIGDAQYRFDSVDEYYAYIKPREGYSEIKIPDATPGVISKYALEDEQALLAKVRYNRLIDIFIGAATFSLQSHLRTKIKEVGQTETDEVYVGIDKEGTHYVFPVQAKGKKDRHNIVQIEQDWAMCLDKFPSCLCRPIAAQFLEEKDNNKIALISFKFENGIAKIMEEKHYLLVDPSQISKEDLESYRALTELQQNRK